MNKIYQGDSLEVLKTFESESIDTCITSPPYWGLRDYGVAGQLGLEKTPEEYVAKMVELFREVKRVLKKGGTLWLNLGDSYAGSMRGYNPEGTKNWVTSKLQKGNAGSFVPPPDWDNVGLKPKDLVGIPWRVAFALQADGWYLRQDIIWAKPNPMPESVTDRCTKSHEYIFLLTKNKKYYFDNEAIREPFADIRMGNPGTPSPKAGRIPGQAAHSLATKVWDKGVENGGRNKRSVWTVTTKPFKEAHFATFPEDLIKPMVLAGCPKNGLVLDPFMGAGTTGVVAKKLDRNYVGVELNPEYIKIAEKRISEIPQKML